jgi:hypothetical protein
MLGAMATSARSATKWRISAPVGSPTPWKRLRLRCDESHTTRILLCIDSVYTDAIDLSHKLRKGPKMTYKSKKVLVGSETVTVTICLTEDEGLDINDGGKWLLICEDHSSIIQDTNKRRLWGSADEVSDWCEMCRINDRVTIGA